MSGKSVKCVESGLPDSSEENKNKRGGEEKQVERGKGSRGRLYLLMCSHASRGRGGGHSDRARCQSRSHTLGQRPPSQSLTAPHCAVSLDIPRPFVDLFVRVETDDSALETPRTLLHQSINNGTEPSVRNFSIIQLSHVLPETAV